MIKFGHINAKSDVVQQIKKVLEAFKVATPDIERHAHMLQELLYFKENVHTNSDRMYERLDPIVKAAAIEFADRLLSKHLLLNANWHNYDVVSKQHAVLQLINTIVRGQNVLSMSDHTLNEWERDICREYVEALQGFSSELPARYATHAPLAAYYESMYKVVCDTVAQAEEDEF
jgi:hypothetical protein